MLTGFPQTPEKHMYDLNKKKKEKRERLMEFNLIPYGMSF